MLDLKLNNLAKNDPPFSVLLAINPLKNIVIKKTWTFFKSSNKSVSLGTIHLISFEKKSPFKI